MTTLTINDILDNEDILELTEYLDTMDKFDLRREKIDLESTRCYARNEDAQIKLNHQIKYIENLMK